MSALPKQDLQAALADLHSRDEFAVLTKFIRDEREALIFDLGACETPFEVMKFAGGIARLDELLRTISKPD